MKPNLNVTAELLASAMDIPRLNSAPLPEYDYERLDYGMAISIERTPRGRLWACWVGGGDNENGFFVLASSDDDGRTWSKPRLVIDPHDVSLPCARRTLVGCLWTDPLGRLWLFFDQSLAYFDGRAGDWVAHCDNPDADAPAWSRPRRIWHGATLNKPTLLANGEWLLPVSLWPRAYIDPRFASAFAELDQWRMAHVFVSPDQGASWMRRGGTAFPQACFDEHSVVQRRDGSLWMLARTREGLWESLSNDGGQTWTAPRPSRIGHISSRFHIRRLLSGRLLLVKHGAGIAERTERRTHLAAFLSADDGANWQGSLLLDERFAVSYPDGCQAADGSIYILYDRNRESDGEILMAKITEEDILAGRLVHPGSRLRQTISRAAAGQSQPPDRNADRGGT